MFKSGEEIQVSLWHLTPESKVITSVEWDNIKGHGARLKGLSEAKFGTV